MILCANPKAQYLAYQNEIDAAIARVLDSGSYVLGEETVSFEREFSEYLGAQHAIGVGSGTEALHIALAACGVGPGDEVITVSHTAVATVAAIELSGASPVLVDIEPNYYTLDPAKLTAAISPKTKAIIPVHLYGQPADMEPIMEIAGNAGLRVIEDCCQAHGSRYHGKRVGTLGDAGCFSFYPTKNLAGIGDGGAVVTGDAAIAERAVELRQYGWKDRYVSQTTGWNSRLDELQASILRVKLRHLDKNNLMRIRLADRYAMSLSDWTDGLPRLRPNCDHVYHLFVVRQSNRDRKMKGLAARGIHAGIHYPLPIHLQPAYRSRVSVCGELSETERVAGEILSLPMYPELCKIDTDHVINAFREITNLSSHVGVKSA